MKKVIFLLLVLALLTSCVHKGLTLNNILTPYIAKYGQPIRMSTFTSFAGLQTLDCRTYYWKNDANVEIHAQDDKHWWVYSSEVPLLEGVDAGN